MSDERTTKIYIVVFRDVFHQTAKYFSTYPIRVRAFDLDDAQEKAIDIIASISESFGPIKSISRSLSQY